MPTSAGIRRLFATMRDPRLRRIATEVLLLERVWRRPLVFEDARGLRYVLYPGENARVYLEHEGNYEVEETALCERVVEAGTVVFDVGANIGLYTLLFSKLVGATGLVHAFEPEPRNFRRLRVNLALNDVQNVVANQLGAFSISGRRALNVYRPELGSWHTFGRPKLTDPLRGHEEAVPEASLDVDIVTLQDYAETHGVEHVDFLKVDVEGAELDVLLGAGRLLDKGRIGVVMFEVSLPQVEGMAHRPEEIFEFLSEHGYRSYAVPDLREVEAADLRYGNYVATRNPDILAAPR